MEDTDTLKLIQAVITGKQIIHDLKNNMIYVGEDIRKSKPEE